MPFKLTSDFKPTGDQPEAIAALTQGIKAGIGEQVLLGVTGSGKTFTMANLIQNLNRPTLVISHNKTLAAQLYQEFKSFFPKNAVSYFVSYYDYYQPEAYIPQTDTYIEKETDINEEIDKLRLAATTNLLTRKDTIVVASVSCIYNIGSPREYARFILELRPGIKVKRESIFSRLVDLQYERSCYGFHRGTFRVRGDTIDLYPAYMDTAIRIELGENEVRALMHLDPISGKVVERLKVISIYPAKHYMTAIKSQKQAITSIEADLKAQVDYFTKQKKFLEAQRLNQRVKYDLAMIRELGYVNGIENYSRYFDGRQPGEAPYTLFDYFSDTYGSNWLLFIDESHMTNPQIRGMYRGDRSRKQTLVDYGFRLPAALDNRPLKFEEFIRRLPLVVYVSATPDEWEISRALEAAGRFRTKGHKLRINEFSGKKGVVEQLIRPTGLIDPSITIRPVSNQIEDLIKEVKARVDKKERILVTTLTKRMAEDLSTYLNDYGIQVHYLHADVETLKRSDILEDLRRGKFDVIVGINLLREGLDLPEVSLVAILDADKAGFLRSRVSLIQTMGRAARHVSGQVIMYADTVTPAMREAIDEVGRRRQVQLAYNQKHGITPTSVSKPVREKLVDAQEFADPVTGKKSDPKRGHKLLQINTEALTPKDIKRLIKRLTSEMRLEAKDLNFELAAEIRDKIKELKMYLS